MTEGTKDGYPFQVKPVNEGSYDKGEFATILELRDDPHFIVKELGKASQTVESITLQDHLAGKKGEPKKGFEWAKSIQEKLEALRTSETGISEFIPENSLVFGQGKNGKEACFIVMEKVEGTKFPDEKFFTEEHLLQVEHVINAALDFYFETRDKSPDGAGLFPDFLEIFYTGHGEFRNLMVGTTQNDPKERMYLIDNYPLLNFARGNRERLLASALLTALRSLDSEIFNNWWSSNEKPVDLDNKGYQDYFSKMWKGTIQEVTTRLGLEPNRDSPFFKNDFKAYYHQKVWKEDKTVPWNEIRQRLEQRLGKMFNQ